MWEQPTTACAICDSMDIVGYDTRPSGEDGEIQEWPICGECYIEDTGEIDVLDAKILATTMLQVAAKDLHGKEQDQDVIDWMEETAESLLGGSFGWCCALIDTDPGVVLEVMKNKEKSAGLMNSKFRRAVLQ